MKPKKYVALACLLVLQSACLGESGPGSRGDNGPSAGARDDVSISDDGSDNGLLSFDANDTGDPEGWNGPDVSYIVPWSLETFARGSERIVLGEVAQITGYFSEERRTQAWSDVVIQVEEWLKPNEAIGSELLRSEPGTTLNEWCAHGYEDYCLYFPPGRFRVGDRVIAFLARWDETGAGQEFAGQWYAATHGGVLHIGDDNMVSLPARTCLWNGSTVDGGTEVTLSEVLTKTAVALGSNDSGQTDP